MRIACRYDRQKIEPLDRGRPNVFRDEDRGRPVAVKVVRLNPANDPEICSVSPP